MSKTEWKIFKKRTFTGPPIREFIENEDFLRKFYGNERLAFVALQSVVNTALLETAKQITNRKLLKIFFWGTTCFRRFICLHSHLDLWAMTMVIYFTKTWNGGEVPGQGRPFKACILLLSVTKDTLLHENKKQVKRTQTTT